MNTSYGIKLVTDPELLEFPLNVFHDQSGSSLLVVHLDVVGSEDQLHITAAVIIEGLPALAHHPIHCYIIS